MTNEDDVARDLVQRAHAAEARPDFDVEAGLSDVLARANADLSQRKGGRSFHVDLAGPVRRSGLFDEGSRFDPATGVGQIQQVSIDRVQRTFSITADGRAVIDTVASGRRLVPFGGVTVWRAETATRHLRVDFAAGRGQISQRVEFQGQELGLMVGREAVDTVTIQWRPGLFDRVHRALKSIQNRLVSRPAAGLPVVEGVLYSYQDAFEALLRDYPRVDEAMRSAAQANDGLLRGVSLGEHGVALVRDGGVILAAADHPWANRAQQAIGPDPSQSAPLIRIEGDRALHVDRSELTIAPGSAKRTSLAEVWNTASCDIYLHEKFRSMLGLDTGTSVSDTTKVIVQDAAIRDRLSVEGTVSEPDVRSHGGAEWWRIRDIGRSVGTGGTASRGGDVVSAVGGLITLVRPDGERECPRG